MGDIILKEVNHLPAGSTGVNSTLIWGRRWEERRGEKERPALDHCSLGSRWVGVVTAHNETQASGGSWSLSLSVSFGTHVVCVCVCVFVLIHACCFIFGCDIKEQRGS